MRHTVPVRQPPPDVLHDDLRLTGTRIGCEGSQVRRLRRSGWAPPTPLRARKRGLYHEDVATPGKLVHGGPDHRAGHRRGAAERRGRRAQLNPLDRPGSVLLSNKVTARARALAEARCSGAGGVSLTPVLVNHGRTRSNAAGYRRRRQRVRRSGRDRSCSRGADPPRCVVRRGYCARYRATERPRRKPSSRGCRAVRWGIANLRIWRRRGDPVELIDNDLGEVMASRPPCRGLIECRV
jgi:hypothetical protein